jgi:hypothetical protein
MKGKVVGEERDNSFPWYDGDRQRYFVRRFSDFARLTFS